MLNTEIAIPELLTKQYDGVTQLIAKTKQRIVSLPGHSEDELDCDTALKGDGKSEGLLTVQGRYSRAIEKELVQWDVWTEWLSKVPGIGAWTAAKLIILFNYKFVPVCKECGGEFEKTEKETQGKLINVLTCVDCGRVAKDGVLKHKVVRRDFPTVSKWWAYMGRHTVDGVMPKRKKGTQANWSTPGRTLGFLIGEQFNRQGDDNPYKRILLQHKEKHARMHPEWSKGHVHNAARTRLLRYSLPTSGMFHGYWRGCRCRTYAGAIMGHTNIIKPPYWESETSFETQQFNAFPAAEMRV